MKTETAQYSGPKKELSKQIIRQAGQSYVFSWAWFIGGAVALSLLCLSVYGMRTLNMINMSKQIVDISNSLEKEGNVKGAIDVLASFLESYPDNPDVWTRQCDLWNGLYETNKVNSRNLLSQAIDRQKRAIPYLSEGSLKEVRERILEMELEVSKTENGTWPNTLINAKEILKQWKNHPLAMKVVAMGNYRLWVAASRRPAVEDLPLDNSLQTAWELNLGDIDLAVDFSSFLREIKADWQTVVSPVLLAKEPTERSAKADEIIDTMVRVHADDANAYLARYEYQIACNKINPSRTDLEPDIAKALELSPHSVRALQFAGKQMFISSQHARLQGNLQEADENRDKSFEYFSKVIEVNPTGPEGYLLLGRWYMASNQHDKALEIWMTGHKKIGYIFPELNGEIAYVSIERKLFDQAKERIRELEQFAIHFGGRMKKSASTNLTRLYSLLRGKMYVAQRDEALAKRTETTKAIDDAKAKGGTVDPALERLVEESGAVAERLRNMASSELRNQLLSLPEIDYDLSGGSVLSRLEGEAFINCGRLEADVQAWDAAAAFYEKGRAFPTVAVLATIQATNAYERCNRPDVALAILQNGATRFPNDSTLRFFYLNALFAQELAKQDPSSRNYALLENELNDVANLQDKLAQPWKIDTMRIQLLYVQGGGTRQVQQECLARLRDLEKNTTYAENPLFLAELASQYSSMGALEDFNRTVERVRELPQNQSLYYVLQIDDARRRGDMARALFLTDEALLAVAETDKQRFVRIKESLENPDSGSALDSDEEYGRLKNLYDGKRIHDPMTFFELGNLAFSRGEVEVAKNIEDRLKQIEGEKNGTYWRYLAVKRLVKQADGDSNSELLNNAQTVQREIVALRPNWDMSYVLKAEIDKETGKINDAIIAYQEAIDRGNRQPLVYRDLISLFYQTGRAEEGERVRRLAGSLFGAAFFESDNMFPPPYQGYYEQIFKAIQEGNIGSADELANACIKKAFDNQEPTDRIMDLNTRIGKLFMDSSNAASAERFLASVAGQGGKFVVPLAVCYMKMEKVDEAYELFVRELEKPTVDVAILRPILILSAQVKPSDAVQQKIDRQLERLEPVFTEKIESLVQLADYWINRDMLNHAIPIYRKGLEIEPGNLLILNNLAMLLAESSRGGKGGGETLTRGTFNANEAKRIPLSGSQPKKTYILRFPKTDEGQAAPNPEDFRFLTTPQ